MLIGVGCRAVFCALVGKDKSKCSPRYSQVVCWLAMVMSWVGPLGAPGRTERKRMQISTSQGAERCYRLIDGGCEPHRELDAQYSSLDDALADAIAWVEAITERNHPAALIGVEVSTTKGGWRTCRMPGPLLCPLPR